MFYTIFESKLVGKILLYGDKTELHGLEFYKNSPIDKNWIEDERVFQNVIIQLEKYFNKELKSFDIPLRLSGTPFQKRVYSQLLQIPYGSTISYQELAKRVDNKKASRAVGNANGKNPIAIIIPCHRVISKDGSIGGFSSKIDIKRKLLELEGVKF